MFNRIFTAMLLAVTLAACAGGGHSSSNPASLAEPTTLDGSLCKPPACELVECRAYANPDSKPVTVDARWRERYDLCCAFNLCSIEGSCYYGCPDEFVQPRCN